MKNVLKFLLLISMLKFLATPAINMKLLLEIVKD